MPPKSNYRNSKKLKQPIRNWLELPSDLMLNVLQRVGVADRLKNVEKVCTAWCEICKDPSMWRVVYIDNTSCNPYVKTELREMCKRAVDRNQGQLLDLTVIDVLDDELQYVADRSNQLRRLEIVDYHGKQLSEALKKLSLLEELSLVRTSTLPEEIEAAGRYCPLLKVLKLNHTEVYAIAQNNFAVAIGKNLPELNHLELIESNINNTELEAILDGCSNLESLDLRGCWNIDIKGEIGKRCLRQIKHLKLPHDSLVGCPHAFDLSDHSENEYDDYRIFDDLRNEDDFRNYLLDHPYLLDHFEEQHDEFYDYDEYCDYCLSLY